jgi:hypothetical protein
VSGHLCPSMECARSHMRGWNDCTGYDPVRMPDEFGPYLEQALQNPAFRRLYEAAERRHRASLPLAINGREYHRRQQARRRHR